MQSFRGKLDMGSTVEDNVTGMLEEQSLPNGIKTFRGTFVVRKGGPIHAGSTGKLVLDDGRTLNILVDRVSWSTCIAEFGPGA